MTVRYLSLCSGIEAATVAWQSLGWEVIGFAEIEPFPCEVLKHHYPNVPNLGDISQIDGRQFRGAVELIVAGTPCQDFSIAGKRAGMAGERSGLAREFVRLVHEINPRWIVWENVPGVFSTNGGRDFGQFIKALDDSGYSIAWRVLDAQFFGVPQRRRRVFVVGYSGDWRPAAKILFESEGLQRNFTPRREKRQNIAGTTQNCTGKGCLHSNVTGTLTARSARGSHDDNMAADGFCVPCNMYAMRTAQASANGLGVTENISHTLDGANGQAIAYAPPIVEQAISCKWAKGSSGPAGDEHHNLIAIQPNKVVGTLYASGAGMERTSCQPCESDMLVLASQQGGAEIGTNISPAVTHAAGASGNNQPVLFQKNMQVRRLIPKECERLQGFPDDYTAIQFRGKPASDSARYKALGNSMAVPVMRWLGKRIDNFCKNGVSAL